MIDPATASSVGELLVQLLSLITSTNPVVAHTIAETINEATAVAAVEASVSAGRGVGAVRQRLLAYAKNPKKPPENHDLQRAVYISFLCATEVIYEARLAQLGQAIELTWFTGLKRELLSKLPDFSPIVLDLNESETQCLNREMDELRQELAVCEVLSVEDLQGRMPFDIDINSLRGLINLRSPGKTLLDAILNHSKWYKHSSEHLSGIARENLWSFMARFFAEQIKANGRVESILTAQLLADTGITIDELKATVMELTNQLSESLRSLVESEFETNLRVIDRKFLEAQRRHERTEYLRISRGDWALVAQDGAIERDQTEQVLTDVHQPSSRTVLQIIRGDPGSGKTTLLLQIGVRLCQQGFSVVEARSTATAQDLLRFALRFARQDGGRLFLLIDDIYRDPDRADEIVEMLSNLGEPLRVTMVATTPSYLDRTRNIRTSSYLNILPPVSPDRLTDAELQRLQNLPGIAWLTPRHFEALTRSRKILVVMLQLTQGKPIGEILSETAKRLKRYYPETWKAWRIVTVFGAHNLAIPSSILNHALGDEFFSHKLLKNPSGMGSEGLLFPSSFASREVWSPFRESWSSGHQLIAQFARDLEFSADLKEVCKTVMECVSAGDPEHSVFFGRVFKFLCGGSHAIPAEAQLATELFGKYEEKILDLALKHPDEMVEWAEVFHKLGKKDVAERCLFQATPTTPGGALQVVSGLEKIGKLRDALRVAANWCNVHPDDTLVRTFMLGLLTRQNWRKGSAAVARLLTVAVQSIRKWLNQHPHDTAVRVAYLNFLEAAGSEKDQDRAITETTTWLAAHPDDISVRGYYLSFVDHGHIQQNIQAVISATSKWLESHPDDTFVRTSYLGLVERKGTPEEISSAITLTAKWIESHPDSSSVRTFFLGLIERRAERQLDKWIDNTIEWIAVHPESTDVWDALIALLIRQNRSGRAIQMVSEAIQAHPNDQNLRNKFLKYGISEMSEIEAAKLFSELENRLPGDNSIVRHKVQWLTRDGRRGEAKQILLDKLRQQPDDWRLHYSLAQQLLDEKEWAEARREFLIVLRHNKGHQMAHEGKGMALASMAIEAAKVGDVRAAAKFDRWAEHSFLSALRWARLKSGPKARLFASLGWFYLERHRSEEALACFEKAADEDPDHYSNSWGRGAAFLKLGRPTEAIEAIRSARDKAPQSLAAEEKAEIQRLLEECERMLIEHLEEV